MAPIYAIILSPADREFEEWLRGCADPVFKVELVRDPIGDIRKPDLLFICMNDGLRGSDVRAILARCGHPKWIMVSDVAADGILAFDLGAIDLLLRPIQFDRFQRCMGRLQRAFIMQGANGAVGPSEQQGDPAEVILKSGKGFVKVMPSNIQLVQGMGNYSKLHLGHTHVLVTSTMAHLADLLPKDRFIRIHRSFIINVDHIRSIGGNTLEWTGGEITLGGVYKKQALELLKQRLSEE